jgi:hypothetical protein
MATSTVKAGPRPRGVRRRGDSAGKEAEPGRRDIPSSGDVFGTVHFSPLGGPAPVGGRAKTPRRRAPEVRFGRALGSDVGDRRLAADRGKSTCHGEELGTTVGYRMRTGNQCVSASLRPISGTIEVLAVLGANEPNRPVL